MTTLSNSLNTAQFEYTVTVDATVGGVVSFFTTLPGTRYFYFLDVIGIAQDISGTDSAFCEFGFTGPVYDDLLANQAYAFSASKQYTPVYNLQGAIPGVPPSTEVKINISTPAIIEPTFTLRFVMRGIYK